MIVNQQRFVPAADFAVHDGKAALNRNEFRLRAEFFQTRPDLIRHLVHPEFLRGNTRLGSKIL
jgi:hypothetical protein